MSFKVNPFHFKLIFIFLLYLNFLLFFCVYIFANYVFHRKKSFIKILIMWHKFLHGIHFGFVKYSLYL